MKNKYFFELNFLHSGVEFDTVKNSNNWEKGLRYVGDDVTKRFFYLF